MNVDKLKIHETLFRGIYGWLEEKNWINGINLQYYSMDFSNVKVTFTGKNYLKQKIYLI
ncbi:YjcQ family protein [Bacillus sp. FSL R9-9410]|uniref:YjcQ family protein n=1 Tax=Bacillus sp. FSL R9-9410 TaxID=2921590 RepID=UPI004049A51E